MENNNIDYILEEKAINLKISYLQKSNFTTLMTTSNTCCIMLCEKGSCHLTLKQNQYEIKPNTLLYTYLPFSVSKEDISNDFNGLIHLPDHLNGHERELISIGFIINSEIIIVGFCICIQRHHFTVWNKNVKL